MDIYDMPTEQFLSVKRLQFSFTSACFIPQVTRSMGPFFPIWIVFIRLVFHCGKKFSTHEYRMTRKERLLKKIHAHMDDRLTSFYHSESYTIEKIVEAFNCMARVMPSNIVISFFSLLEKSVFEPRFEKYWKESRDKLVLVDPELYIMRYAFLTAIDHVYGRWRNFVQNMFPMPPKISFLKLSWRRPDIYLVEPKTPFANIAHITRKKRLNLLERSTLRRFLISRLCPNSKLLPLSPPDSRFRLAYSRCFSEVTVHDVVKYVEDFDFDDD